MKVASIGFTAEGGAGLSSLKLHKEFLRQGIDSRFYVLSKKKDLEQVHRINRRSLPDDVAFVPVREGVRNIVASGFAVAQDASVDAIYDWADVVLLRWVSSVVSDFKIARWSYGSKPIVWCLSDMAPLTGGCHYSNGCKGYISDCRKCPMTDSRFSEIPARTLSRRVRTWRQLTVVSPSRWLFGCSSESAVFRGKDVRLIRTGVELDVFRPYPSPEARREFGLPLDKIIIFLASHSVSDPRKGFDLMRETISAMHRAGAGKDVLVVTAGLHEPPKFELDAVHVGYVADREKLSKLYSASDVTALPYREDNLPNVLLESIACGVPVCAYDVGGMPDVIVPGFNGCLVKPYDTEEFGRAILKCVSSDAAGSRRAIRAWAEQEIGIHRQAEQYIELFSEKLRERRSWQPLTAVRELAL
jgi:glycosyltransferase involved in cell wall biosynthesis